MHRSRALLVSEPGGAIAGQDISDIHVAKPDGTTACATPAFAPAAGERDPWRVPGEWSAQFNGSLDLEAVATRMQRYTMADGNAGPLCGDVPALVEPAASITDNTAHVYCDDPASIGRSQVRLLVGVISSPAMKSRRDAIRTTWAGVPSRTALVCFVLGSRVPSQARLTAMSEERAAHRDVIWLPRAVDGCGTQYAPISKFLFFWKAAAAILEVAPAIAHVAKVDDDSFVHLPNLEADLARLHCVRHLSYGRFAWLGVRPSPLAVCGFSWPAIPHAYLRRGCASRGFHPPTPFAVGMLQLLSRDVVLSLAASRDAERFVLEAGPTPPKEEDAVLGFWVSRVSRKLNLTHVRVGGRMSDIACNAHRGQGPLQQIAPEAMSGALVVHQLKTAGGQHYIWDLIHGGVPHQHGNCSYWTKSADHRECWADPDPTCRPWNNNKRRHKTSPRPPTG